MKKPPQDKIGMTKSAQIRLVNSITSSVASLALFTAAQSPLMAKPAKEPVAAEQSEGDAELSEEEKQDAAINKFFIEGYNYCDAKVLADFWGEDTDFFAAKVLLGNKMLEFGVPQGKALMKEARAATLKKPEEEWPIWYVDGGYEYDDAELLGEFWGTEIDESKSKMTRLLIQGKDAQIQAALKKAKADAKGE